MTAATGLIPRRAGVVLDPWASLGFRDLTDTVRQICTRAGWTTAPNGGRSLAITSAVRREGKSSIARALAITMARDHAEDVLLIECDLPAPTLSSDFGVASEPGLSNVLSGETEFSAALHQTEIPSLWVMPAGQQHDNPSRLLRSAAMSQLLAEARGRFAFIILDLPALLATSDASVLAHLVDGVILVVRARSTYQKAVAESLDLLSGVQLYGVVVNRWRSAVPRFVRRILDV